MQTFLPFSDFKLSAQALDKRRCWKQVVEARQIINTLTGESEGWKHHPVMKMWKGYAPALGLYYNTFWRHSVEHHGIKAVKLQLLSLPQTFMLPDWLGDEEFHQSHINNLARKAMAADVPDLYNALVAVGIKPDDQDLTAPYIWPISQFWKQENEKLSDAV